MMKLEIMLVWKSWIKLKKQQKLLAPFAVWINYHENKYAPRYQIWCTYLHATIGAVYPGLSPKKQNMTKQKNDSFDTTFNQNL